jgi:hypothetical protein
MGVKSEAGSSLAMVRKMVTMLLRSIDSVSAMSGDTPKKTARKARQRAQ